MPLTRHVNMTQKEISGVGGKSLKEIYKTDGNKKPQCDNITLDKIEFKAKKEALKETKRVYLIF